MPSQTSLLLWGRLCQGTAAGGGEGLNLRDGVLERVDSVSVLLHQRPADGLVQRLDRLLGFLGDVSQDRVHHLALVEPLFALDDIFGRDAALGKIDVS
jgi:hypothetical protein